MTRLYAHHDTYLSGNNQNAPLTIRGTEVLGETKFYSWRWNKVNDINAFI